MIGSIARLQQTAKRPWTHKCRARSGHKIWDSALEELEEDYALLKPLSNEMQAEDPPLNQVEEKAFLEKEWEFQEAVKGLNASCLYPRPGHLPVS